MSNREIIEKGIKQLLSMNHASEKRDGQPFLVFAILPCLFAAACFFFPAADFSGFCIMLLNTFACIN